MARADFSSSFRGFDHTEVRSFLARVAGELRGLAEREDELLEQVAKAERRLPTPMDDLDEHQVTERLGAEAARVLEAARDGARQIRAKADADAEAVVAEAERAAAEVLASSEAVLGERTEEAESAAAGIRDTAESEVAELREAVATEVAEQRELAEAEVAELRATAAAEVAALRAEADQARRQMSEDAEAELERARAEGRRMVAEARAVRERILTDMARRRNVAKQQVERLRAGRDRLLDAVQVVRKAVEETTEELNDAVVEARLAGERAARQVDVDAIPTARELDIEVELAKDAGLIDPASYEPGRTDLDDPTADAALEPTPTSDEAAEPAPAPAEDEPVDVDAVLEDGVDQVDEAPEPIEALETVEAPEPIEPLETVEVPEPVEPLEAVEAPEADEAAATAEPAAADELAGSEDAPTTASAPVAEAETVDVAAELTEPQAETASPKTRSRSKRKPRAAGTSGRRAGFGSAVDDVFSRMKTPEEQAAADADLAAAATPAAAVDSMAADPASTDISDDTPDAADGPAAPTPDPADVAVTAAVGAEVPADAVPHPVVEVEPDVDAVALHRRDAQVAGAVRDLSRLLKLALADEQNELLEGARSKGGVTAANLPDPTVRQARFVALADRELAAASEAGWRSVLPQGPEPGVVDVADVARGVAEDLLEGLHERLEDGVGTPEVFTERVRSLYRDLRNQRTSAASEHAVLVAFGRGQLAAARAEQEVATQDGADAAVLVRWASHACGPDCLDNSLAGPITPGDVFPTGHAHPPAFAGCRCVLVVEQVTTSSPR